MIETKADRQKNNARSSEHFAIAMAGLIGVFIIHHWLRLAYLKYGSRKPGRLTRSLILSYRAGRRFLNQTVLGLHVGRWSLYLLYWAINAILAVTEIDLGNIISIAKRLGWVATCNFALLVFLALRNTPLAPLSGRSYEQLRPLHKTAGYTCIVTSTVHAIVYCKAWSNKLHEMLITANVAGIVGGLAMLVLGLSTISRFVRKSYEVFYAIHIVLFLLITVMVGMHRPVLAKKALIIVIWTGGIWFLDRLLRLSKFFRYFLGNYATITALPEDAIRVTLKAGVSSTPGSHAFLWVPSVRLMETHPFTFVRTDPAEFLIRVHDGFTRDLYLAAQKEPGRMIKCSVDGGYGQIPNFNRFDTIVLIAGGSGASFTFPIALGVIQAAAVAHTAKTIDFIWAVRSSDCLSWYQKELDQLRENPRVNVYIYVTRDSGPSTLVEKSPAVYPSSDPSNTGSDLEKASSINSAPQPLTTTPVVRNERPDIARHLADRIALCASEQQVGVGVCGPSSMVSQTRESLSQGNGGTYGPSITLHTEEFEW